MTDDKKQSSVPPKLLISPHHLAPSRKMRRPAFCGAGWQPLLSKLARNSGSWTGQAPDSTWPAAKPENEVGWPGLMLSKLRPDPQCSVSQTKSSRTSLWRGFQEILPGGLAEPLAFCCPNWVFEKPNLDTSGCQPAPHRASCSTSMSRTLMKRLPHQQCPAVYFVFSKSDSGASGRAFSRSCRRGGLWRL